MSGILEQEILKEALNAIKYYEPENAIFCIKRLLELKKRDNTIYPKVIPFLIANKEYSYVISVLKK